MHGLMPLQWPKLHMLKVKHNICLYIKREHGDKAIKMKCDVYRAKEERVKAGIIVGNIITHNPTPTSFVYFFMWEKDTGMGLCMFISPA